MISKVVFFIPLILLGCGDGVINTDYLVAGQSNAQRCNWGYLETLTNERVESIAIGGKGIDALIDEYPGVFNAKAILFVHGETDGAIKTPPDYYVERVEHYRQLISSDVGKDLPIYISTVGYHSSHEDTHFDLLRNAVKEYKNDKWIIAYDDAQYFRDWGMIVDEVHFSKQGCRLMMEGFYNSISKL